MNITDIDDKIIKRARQHHLYEQYIAKNHSLDEVLDSLSEVVDMLKGAIETTRDKEKLLMLSGILDKVSEVCKNIEDNRNSDCLAEVIKVRPYFKSHTRSESMVFIHSI